MSSFRANLFMIVFAVMLKTKIIIMLLMPIFLMPIYLSAEEEGEDDNPSYIGATGRTDRVKWLDINMGPLFLPNKVFRGATFYRYPLILPGAVINFFDDKLVIMGPRIVSSINLSEKIVVSSSLAFIWDNATLGIFGSQKGYRGSRPNSLEISFGISYTPVFPLKLSFDFYQDTISHIGQYYELGFDYKAFRFMSDERPLLFVSVYSMFGIGSESHNDYLYGPEGERGFNNYKSGISLVFPDLFLGTTVINRFYYNGILGDGNRNASLVSDRPGSFSGMLLLQRRLPI